MTQHFLLSAKARTAGSRVFEMNEEQAFKVFKKVRWGDSKEVTCPMCGVSMSTTSSPLAANGRCKDCNHTFSVTSGTIFAFHKLPLKLYLAAIAIYTNAVKEISAMQMGRDLDVQYKTAFVLTHKIRESLMAQRDASPLSVISTWTVHMSTVMCARRTKRKIGLIAAWPRINNPASAACS